MIDYRIDMLHLHARNYLPKLLGQFFIHPEGEKPEDIAWLMALSTGYDAGFSLTFGRGSSSYMQGEPTSETARIRPANLSELTTIIRSKSIPLCDELKPGERFRFIGGTGAKVHDRAWKTLRTYHTDLGSIQLSKGATEFNLFWTDKDGSATALAAEFRLPGEAIPLKHP